MKGCSTAVSTWYTMSIRMCMLDSVRLLLLLHMI